MTLNTTWGYSEHDRAWKSEETLIRNLIDIASKGGNYLLNIGPKGDGSVPAESVKTMRAIGAWTKVNGEGIYGTTASAFKKLAWGRCTKKLSPEGATLYLHVFNWPKDGQLRVPGLKSPVTSATLLATGAKLKAQAGPEGVKLLVPANAPDPISSTVVLRVTGALQVE